MMLGHYERGQTLPMWAFGTLMALVLIAVSMTYAQTLRWQLRAQNAADAAARGLLASQTSQWNETTSTLHAAAVEEYRIRYLMNDLLEVVRGSGGCDNVAGHTGSGTCGAIYSTLRQRYLDAVTRYTADVQLLQQVSHASQSDQVKAMQAALDVYQDPSHCNTAAGGDCAFKYTLIASQPRKDSYLEDVYSDCCAFVVGGSTSASPKDDLAPLKIEVVACASVTPVMPTFFNFKPQPFQAIGRAAATSIMTTQEFLYVGSIVNNATTKVLQSAEFPESTSNTSLGFAGDDANYRIDFGGNPSNTDNNGNPATSDGKFGFVYTPRDQGLLAATGWWQSMPIKPFSGALQSGVTFTCK
ncbi:MAG: hypothetical protein JO165_09350 [Candidatus Eremiobacteraeota bacterium]|nr:hypothetical protein [Candidatus Eremiobacteraeota bacterium]